MGRTEQLGGEDGAFELALHEADRSLQGLCHIVVRLHERVLSVMSDKAAC